MAEPLEKGFGQTMKLLRRILLSSIQGGAIAIQIDGVLHEFSSIKGVRGCYRYSFKCKIGTTYIIKF